MGRQPVQGRATVPPKPLRRASHTGVAALTVSGIPPSLTPQKEASGGHLRLPSAKALAVG